MAETRAPRAGIAGLAIRRPIGTLALASVVLVLGVFFFQRLAIDLLPEVAYPQIRATVNYPGTAPEVMEEQVTRVMERHLAATENLERIYSRASEGRTNVNLVFGFGTDLDAALQDASRHLELARTQMPRDIEPPRLYKYDPAQDPVWEAGFSSSVRDEIAVRDWVEQELAPRLIAIRGVSGVEAAGGQIREVEVLVDQPRLHAYGLTLNDLAEALAEENVEMAGGWVTSPDFDVMAKTEARLADAEAVRNVLLRLPGDNSPHIRLSEVAEIRDGARPQRLFVRLDGMPAAQVAVYKLPGANTVEVVDAVRARMTALEAAGFIPDDIAFHATRDPSFFIRGSLGTVGTAAVVGGVLAMLIVLLFLGSLRRSFVIGLSIPIAIMATFALMGLGGLTLNIISLGGLALGIGLMLDNSIVMLENITRHRRQLRRNPESAAQHGAGEVVSAVTAGTMTNLAAVFPFLLMSGMAALIFRDLILTLSFAIAATLAAALTVVPMLAALMMRLRLDSGLGRSRPIAGFDRGISALRRRYRHWLAAALRHRGAVLGAAAVLTGGALLLTTTLGTEFLPQVDDGNVRVRMMLPPGTPPQVTDAAARRIEAAVSEQPHVDTLFTMVGGHLGGGIVNERPGTANIWVQLVPAGQRPDWPAGEWVRETQQRLDALDMPGARISVRPPSIRGLQFSLTGDDLSVGVMGADLAALRERAAEVLQRLDGIDGLDGLEIGREDRSPLLRLRIDRERAADLGLRPGDIARAVRDAVDGRVATRMLSDGREYDVRLRLPTEEVGDADALGALRLQRADGPPVALRDLAELTLGDGPAHIEREGQSRIVRVNGTFNTAVADVGTIMNQVEARLSDLALSQGESLQLGGQWETIEETNRELRTVIALAIFLVFVVLAVQYERLAGPLIILTAVPLALSGVVVALWLTDTPLSAPAMIGLLLLVGIVVNNAILLVEAIERRRRQGIAAARAVVSAGGERLRPIMMTTATTILGMTPLAIGLGEGGEIMRPLAITVVGGMSTAMLLTLVVIPCLYLPVDYLARGIAARGSHTLLHQPKDHAA